MIPPCPLFGRCGGCQLQHLSYDEQLSGKAQRLRLVFGRDVAVHPSPHPFGYRGRMDFIIAASPMHEGKTLVGLRGKSSHAVIDVKDCPLLPLAANAAFLAAKTAIIETDLPPYDLHARSGFLRYLTLRHVSSGETMLILTTTTPRDEERRACETLLDHLSISAASVVWMAYDGTADDSVRGDILATRGKDSLTETIADRKYSIAPTTFFQSNRDVADLMARRVASNVSGKTLDLYCGVGTLTLAAAGNASTVVGVEEVSASIVAARHNAAENDVTNVSFFDLSADFFLRDAILRKDRYDTVIVDPPRAGLSPETARALARLAPGRIIYMSCNPHSLKNDLAALLGSYDLASLEAYDMFPQTEHVECLAVLERKASG
jgi:23S rRNA (uracil1939-C5)-methyltransferase